MQWEYADGEILMRQGLTSYLIRLGTITWLVLVLAITLANPLPAKARLMQERLSPQIQLAKSLHTLKDNHGYSWQVIAFQRVQGDRPDPPMLRLVGFPGATTVDHSQPLQVLRSSASTVLLADVSAQIFAAAGSAARGAQEISQNIPQNIPQNVAQYELQPLLSQLGTTLPVRLVIPMVGGEPRELRAPPGLIEEWQRLAR
ncbi:MAG: DUF3122 domain-containing protein [Synechococcales bacterium]|nr:DUF3122 domain-containing protein [Synechococcales bacterium]